MNRRRWDGLCEWTNVEQNENDTTRPATQVGQRPVKAGLGGHDDGVLGDGEGVKKASIPLRKLWRTALSECATLNDFVGVENTHSSENRSVRTGVADNSEFFRICYTNCVL